MDKVELVVQALQQRIGEIVSQYETHIAVLRAEITQLTIRIQEMEAPKEQPEE
jgi:phage host-nuclease inhibitor protein Gam